ncbi:MAG: hypothetical protein DRH33_06640, partial [Candidatus Nealsonbacteria bacterium]
YKNYSVVFIIFFLVSIILRNYPYWENLLFFIFLYATLASSWNIIGGYAGQISLCNGAFFGIGMYVSSLLFIKYGISPWFGMIFGAISAVLIVLTIGSLLFWRLKSGFFALASLTIVIIFYRICIYLKGLTGGSEGLAIPVIGGPENMIFSQKFYYVIIAMVVCFITIITSAFIKSHKLGYQLIALKENDYAAESLGIDTFRCKLKAFIASAVFPAMIGAVYSQYAAFIEPSYAFSIDVSIKSGLITLIGGMSTVAGPFIGAIVMVSLEFILRSYFGGGDLPGIDIFVNGIVLILVVIYMPSGFLEKFELLINKYIDKKEKANVLSDGGGKKKMISNSNGNGFFSHKQEENIKTSFNDRSIIFRASNLTKKFGGLIAVDNLSFEVREGSILGVIGPNGAGKTTLYNLITGFYPLNNGKIEFKGKIISGLNSPNIICRNYKISRTFQVVKLFANLTVLENIIVGAFCRENDIEKATKKAQKVVEFIGLKKYANTLAHSLPIALKKSLELGRSLATEPELLLLDESMAGLTPEEMKDLIELIRKISKSGITIIIIEHVMKAIMTLSERIIVLNYGKKIAEGTPKEIAQNEKVIEVYTGQTAF